MPVLCKSCPCSSALLAFVLFPVFIPHDGHMGGKNYRFAWLRWVFGWETQTTWQNQGWAGFCWQPPMVAYNLWKSMLATLLLDFVRCDLDLHRLPFPIMHVENPIPRATLGRFLWENAYSPSFSPSLGSFWVLSLLVAIPSIFVEMRAAWQDVLQGEKETILMKGMNTGADIASL